MAVSRTTEAGVAPRYTLSPVAHARRLIIYRLVVKERFVQGLM